MKNFTINDLKIGQTVYTFKFKGKQHAVSKLKIIPITIRNIEIATNFINYCTCDEEHKYHNAYHVSDIFWSIETLKEHLLESINFHLNQQSNFHQPLSQ